MRKDSNCSASSVRSCLRADRRSGSRHEPAQAPHGATATCQTRAMRLPATFRAPRRGPLLQAVKSAVATIAAWLIAGWLVQGPPPVFAAIAALLVVQPSLNQSFTRATARSVGVIVGVVNASVPGILFGTHTWVMLDATAVASLAAWALK